MSGDRRDDRGVADPDADDPAVRDPPTPDDPAAEGVTVPDGGSVEDRYRASHESGAVLTTGDTTVIARTSVRIVVPIILLTSLSLLFQGHNLPGGGFVGGVLTATAFALVYVVYGLDYVLAVVLDHDVERSEAPDVRSGAYRTVFAAGLALAAGSGLVPVLLGLPFLTQAVVFLEGLPLYGEFEVASAFAFDLGVYLVVVGGLLTILREVGEE